MKTSSRLLASLLAALVLASSTETHACGPFFERAIFVHEAHPDFPLDGFAAGRIGILRPSYARSYLAVAYRHLSGVGLDASEQAAVDELWDKRLGIAHPSEVTPSPEEKWFEAREAVLGKAERPGVSSYKTMSGSDFYFEFLNCNPSAFLTAAATLGDRVKTLGVASAAVKDWVTAQDAVFSNCAGEGQKSIPPALPATASAALRADRAYQIASALFYSGAFQEAESAFRAIARDAASPWRPLAPYLAARAMIRRATVSGGGIDRELIAKARKELEGILSDPAQQKIHETSRRLLAFAILRSDPAGAAAEKSKDVLRKGVGKGLTAALEDYTFALDTLPSPLPPGAQQDPLTDWILTFQAVTEEARTRSLAMWRQTKSLPWLLASLAKARAVDADVPALIEAAKKVPASSAGATMAAYHLARLEAETGKPEKARERLDALLAASNGLPASARNEITALRLKTSPSLPDALRFLGRIPSTFSYNEDGRELPAEEGPEGKAKTAAPLLDEDGARLFNEALPLDRWIEAAGSKDLPEGIRQRVLLAGWVRSAVLDDVKAAGKFQTALAGAPKDVTQAIESYAGARTKDERLFVAALITLRFPGLRPSVDPNVPRQEPIGEIDSFRNNWWCAGGTSSSAGEAERSETWTFLPAADAQKGKDEAARLKAQGTAPNFLTQTVIDYVNKASSDERGAEALHLAVRSTRYGCTDASTTRLSKAAFQLLKKKFPKSSWAAQTKYWY